MVGQYDVNFNIHYKKLKLIILFILPDFINVYLASWHQAGWIQAWQQVSVVPQHQKSGVGQYYLHRYLQSSSKCTFMFLLFFPLKVLGLANINKTHHLFFPLSVSLNCACLRVEHLSSIAMHLTNKKIDTVLTS